jgi:hypothetical protein
MSQTLAVANGDLDINAVGSVDIISGRDKVNQDIAEILLSNYDRSRNYGGRLQTMSVPGAGAKSIISAELQTIMSRLQAMQSQDPTITAAERISAVQSIKVGEINATDFTFQIVVQTADSGSVVLTDSVTYRSIQLSQTYPNGIQPFTVME